MGANKGDFGGVPLAMAAQWESSPGPAPSMRILTFHKSVWSRVEALLGTYQTLTIQRGVGGAKIQVKRLTGLREMPSPRPWWRCLLVADRRWKWAYRIVVRDYNVTRRTGTKHVVGGAPVELQGSADDYTYTKWSKKPDGSPWKAKDIIEDVLKDVLSDEVEAGDDEGFRIESTGGDGPTVENVQIADTGTNAVARALRLIPTAELACDHDGSFRVYSAIDQKKTDAIVKALGQPTNVSGVLRKIDMRAVRPKKGIVYFEREIEVRFDAENAEDDSSTRAADPADDMRLTNVLILPDPTATIGGQQFASGSYVDFPAVLPVWAAQIGTVGAMVPLTFQSIRRMWFILDGYYTPFGNLTTNADEQNWTARVGAIKGHYRQTYRIPPQWRDAIKDIKPWRVGVLDPINKIHGPARAWSEYAIEPSAKFRLVTRDRPDKQYYWLNVEGYPGIDGELHDNACAPCLVQVLDPQVGILRLEYRTDPYGMRSQIVPSCLRMDGGSGDLAAPTRDLSEAKGPFATQWRLTGAAPIGLSGRFGAAIIVTAMPGSPQGKDRLHPIAISPSQLDDSFERDFTTRGGTAPTLHIYCPPSVMTAWYAWMKTSDARNTAKILFGLKQGSVGAGGRYPGYEVVNQGGSSGLLEAVAKALFSLHMAQWVDQWEGQQATTLTPSIVPGGNVDQILHAITPDGRVRTQVTLPAARRALDFMSLVPAELRNAILGTIAPGRG